MRLSMPTRVILSLAAVHLVQQAVAWACSCTQDAMTVSEQTLEDYDEIFVGTAGRTSGWSCQASADHSTRFEVTEAFVGVEVGDTVKIEHALDGAACGMEFDKGESYLVVAVEGRTNLCTPTWLASESEANIATLRALVAD